MVLTAFYQLEVHKRNCQLIKSDELNTIIDRIARHLTEPKKIGLFFMGGVGCGKSTMMYAIQAAHNYLYPSGRGIIIKDATELTRNAAADADKVMGHYKQIDDMLAIDDLGKEPTEVMVYGSVIQPMVEIFEQRYNRMLPMLITTNLERKQVAEKYGRRIADRFNEMFEVIVFNEESYRKRCDL